MNENKWFTVYLETAHGRIVELHKTTDLYDAIVKGYQYRFIHGPQVGVASMPYGNRIWQNGRFVQYQVR